MVLAGSCNVAERGDGSKKRITCLRLAWFGQVVFLC